MRSSHHSAASRYPPPKSKELYPPHRNPSPSPTVNRVDAFAIQRSVLCTIRVASLALAVAPGLVLPPRAPHFEHAHLVSEVAREQLLLLAWCSDDGTRIDRLLEALHPRRRRAHDRRRRRVVDPQCCPLQLHLRQLPLEVLVRHEHARRRLRRRCRRGHGVALLGALLREVVDFGLGQVRGLLDPRPLLDDRTGPCRRNDGRCKCVGPSPDRRRGGRARRDAEGVRLRVEYVLVEGDDVRGRELRYGSFSKSIDEGWQGEGRTRR